MSFDEYDDDVEFADVESADDEFGYTDASWESLDPDEVELHDEIITMSVDEIPETVFDHPSPLVRWAAAQVFADDGEFEVFEQLARSIVTAEWTHPALDYEEITAELFVDACLEENEEFSKELLRLLESKLGEDDLEVARMRAFGTTIFAGHDEGLEVYQELLDEFADHIELNVQIAYDFILFGEFDAANDVLDAAENYALMQKDDDAALLVADARQTLAIAQNEHDSSR